MYPDEDLTPSHRQCSQGLAVRAARIFRRRAEHERARVARALARDRWGEIREYAFRGPDPSLTQEELALMK